MSNDPLGDLAHIITGSIANSCCFITGGHNSNPRCECRAVAQQLVDYADEAIDAMRLSDPAICYPANATGRKMLRTRLMISALASVIFRSAPSVSAC